MFIRKWQYEKIIARLDKLESEVGQLKDNAYIINTGVKWPCSGFFMGYYGPYYDKYFLSLKEVVQGICTHLKIKFVVKEPDDIPRRTLEKVEVIE